MAEAREVTPRGPRRPVLFVHGAGPDEHEGSAGMAASLRDALGPGYAVRHPEMPEAGDPRYAAWRDRVSAELAALPVDEAVLVGHSLGASVLLKHLSEEEPRRPVSGLFLLAPPFWREEGWEVEEYALREDFALRLPEGLRVFLYHGRDDEVVPFAHLELYAARLPRATVRRLDGRGHWFGGDLSVVARDIMGL